MTWECFFDILFLLDLAWRLPWFLIDFNLALWILRLFFFIILSLFFFLFLLLFLNDSLSQCLVSFVSSNRAIGSHVWYSCNIRSYSFICLSKSLVGDNWNLLRSLFKSNVCDILDNGTLLWKEFSRGSFGWSCLGCCVTCCGISSISTSWERNAIGFLCRVSWACWISWSSSSLSCWCFGRRGTFSSSWSGTFRGVSNSSWRFTEFLSFQTFILNFLVRILCFPWSIIIVTQILCYSVISETLSLPSSLLVSQVFWSELNRRSSILSFVSRVFLGLCFRFFLLFFAFFRSLTFSKILNCLWGFLYDWLELWVNNAEVINLLSCQSICILKDVRNNLILVVVTIWWLLLS